MNILFLSLSRFDDINVRDIYADLMREFIKRGNEVFIASPSERRFGQSTHLIKTDHYQILKIKTLNLQKTNVVEKGIGTLLLERQFDRAIKKYWGDINFDLILYATPPITFNRVIEGIKKRSGCPSYLMLKDIFPQNAVDLGMMKKDGVFHKLFRKKEKRLYEISDRIGCMSPANCDYILQHNPSLSSSKVELCPNAIAPIEVFPIEASKAYVLLKKLEIPKDKILYVYGGNLGKPQGVEFLLKVIEVNEKRGDSFIIIVGGGTEYNKISSWFESNKPKNSKLLSVLPKQEYDNLIRLCQVGLIFLDHRFTIPNFPSRLLSYLENSMPVLLATDKATDMGKIAIKEGFGLWSESGDIEGFMANMDYISKNMNNLTDMGIRGHNYFLNNYTVDKVADIILCPSEKEEF